VFAAVNDDGEVLLQDLKTGGVRARQRAHDDKVYAVAMSPDGKLVATAGADFKLKLWEVGDVPAERNFGPKVAVWQDEGDVGYVGGPFRFTADGRWLVNDHATVFDVARRQVRPADLIFSCMSLAPSSKTIVIGLEGASDVKEKRLRFLDLPTLKERRAALDTFGSVKAVRHSPDGKQLVVLLHEGDEHRLLLLDPESGVVRATVAKWDSDPPDQFAFSADSRMLAVTRPGGLIWWDVSTGTPKEVRSVPLSTGSYGLAFIDGGRALAVRLDDHEAAVYDVATGTLRSTSNLGVSESNTQAEYALICPRRGLFISGRSNGEFLVWDLLNARLLAKKEAHRATILGVALSADERFLATGGKDDKVKVWSLGN
jgi:WD40 repeat protein